MVLCADNPFLGVDRMDLGSTVGFHMYPVERWLGWLVRALKSNKSPEAGIERVYTERLRAQWLLEHGGGDGLVRALKAMPDFKAGGDGEGAKRLRKQIGRIQAGLSVDVDAKIEEHERKTLRESQDLTLYHSRYYTTKGKFRAYEPKWVYAVGRSDVILADMQARWGYDTAWQLAVTLFGDVLSGGVNDAARSYRFMDRHERRYIGGLGGHFHRLKMFKLRGVPVRCIPVDSKGSWPTSCSHVKIITSHVNDYMALRTGGAPGAGRRTGNYYAAIHTGAGGKLSPTGELFSVLRVTVYKVATSDERGAGFDVVDLNQTFASIEWINAESIECAVVFAKHPKASDNPYLGGMRFVLRCN